MAKRKGNAKSKPKRPRAPRTRSAGRTNTHKPNGGLSESMAVAPTSEPERVPAAEAGRRALAELGDLKVDHELSAHQLEDIGIAHEEVIRQQAILASKKEDVKVAKAAVKAAEDLRDEKIRMYTHPESLPLFDETQAESDHEAMLNAAETGGEVDDLGDADSITAGDDGPEPIEESI